MYNVEIVILTPDWCQQYRNLRLKALKEEPQAYGSSYEENAKHPASYWEQRLKDIVQNNTQWLVFAQLGSKLVGMAGAFAEKEVDNAHIVAVYVVPEERGKGVSKRLMNDLIIRIQRNKLVKKITVDVNSEQLPAFNLYKSLGFRIIKEYRMALGDGKEHNIYQLQMLINNL